MQPPVMNATIPTAPRASRASAAPVLPPDGLFDAFISYSHADAAQAHSLVRELQARDLTVWIDQEQIEPGDLFVRVLEQGMQASRSVLLLVSARSQASDWVTEEYAHALNLINGRRDDKVARRLVPVLIDEAEPSGFLASRQCVDLRNPAERGASLDRLASTLRRPGARAAQPAPASVAPSAARALPSGTAPDGIDEVQYLTRYIDRLRDGSARVRRARNWSPGVGAIVTLPAFWLLGEQVALQTLGAASGAAVTGLIGWGCTAFWLAGTERKVETLLNLRDGIELCRLRAAPMCGVLEQRFWSLVDGSSQVRQEAAP